MKYRKTKRRYYRVRPGNQIRLPGSRVRLDLRKLAWWYDPIVMIMLRCS